MPWRSAARLIVEVRLGHAHLRSHARRMEACGAQSSNRAAGKRATCDPGRISTTDTGRRAGAAASAACSPGPPAAATHMGYSEYSHGVLGVLTWGTRSTRMGHAHLVLQRQQRLHQLRIVARHRPDANLPHAAALTHRRHRYGARLGSLAEREPSCDMARHGPSKRADVPHGGRKGAGAGVRSPETRRSGRSCRSPAAPNAHTARPRRELTAQ